MSSVPIIIVGLSSGVVVPGIIYIHSRLTKRLEDISTTIDKQGKMLMRLADADKVMLRSVRKSVTDNDMMESAIAELKTETRSLRMAFDEHKQSHKELLVALRETERKRE